MSAQYNETKNVIIGEAALNITTGDKNITVNALINELGHMADAGCGGKRINAISEAREWLQSFDDEEDAVLQMPYLQTLVNMNSE